MNIEELQSFLEQNPFISLKPSIGGSTVLEGELGFRAAADGLPELEDAYKVRIHVLIDFPRSLPTVTEIGGRVPPRGRFHMNDDGTLCLGSALSLMIRLQQEPTLSRFFSRCVVPYLYAMSLTLKHGHHFPFGELNHGRPGLIDDYLEMFGLQHESQLLEALDCLALKKRLANKRLCPCRCGKRLGRCIFNYRIRHLRGTLPRSWFRKHVRDLKSA